MNTNASNPKVIEELIRKELIDHIAIDFKAPLDKYEKVIGTKIDTEKIEKSLEICSNFKFLEIRTTFVPNFLDIKDLIEIVMYLKNKVKNFFYVIQQFNPSNTLINLNWKYVDINEIIEIAKIVKEKTKLEKIYIRTKANVKEI